MNMNAEQLVDAWSRQRTPILQAHVARGEYVVSDTLRGTLDEGRVVTSIRIPRWGVIQFWVRLPTEKLKELVADHASAGVPIATTRRALTNARMRNHREGAEMALVMARVLETPGRPPITIGQNAGAHVARGIVCVRGESRMIGYVRWRPR
jgi:hypothetical protein